MPCASVSCQVCGHLFLDMRFNETEMARLYDNYRSEEYVNTRDMYEPGYREKNKTLNDGYRYMDQTEEYIKGCVCPNPIILDYGSGSDLNTPLKKDALKIDLYDFAKPTILYRNHYDLVVCANVLEHASDPLDILNRVTRHMSDKSVLFIEIPYENTMKETEDHKDLFLKKKHWHEHVNFFTWASISKLVERSDLRVFKSRELKIDGESSDHVIQLVCIREVYD